MTTYNNMQSCPILLTPDEILDDVGCLAAFAPNSRAALRHAAHYVRSTLTAADPNLGRPGPVCPYVGPALRQDGIKLAAYDTQDRTTMIAQLDQLRIAFLTSVPEGSAKIYRAFMAIFPTQDDASFAALINDVQTTLKPSFVANGLMIGEFYPSCPAPGLHNKNFRPLDTTFTCLAIRHIALADAPFLLMDDQFIASYLVRFGREGALRIIALRDKPVCPDHRWQAITKLIEPFFSDTDMMSAGDTRCPHQARMQTSIAA